MWDKLFGGSLMDLIPFPSRLSFPEPDVQILRVTGDAVLGRFDAIGWAAKEFPDEINPAHRQLAICDSEQVGATSIITLWGKRSAYYRWGPTTQTRWNGHRKDMQRRGEWLTLNQETAKWIVKKELIIEGFYLCSGNNSIDGWRSRPDLYRIIERSRRMGFYRSRFRARWGEFIADWKQNQDDNWTSGPFLSGRDIPRFPGICAEWNSAG